jgi:hypothetical protein
MSTTATASATASATANATATAAATAAATTAGPATAASRPPLKALTPDRVERHFRAMLPAARVLPMEELSGAAGIACVDGRSPRCVAGAPGGNAGLLVLLLTAWEESAGRRLAPAEVHGLVSRYLDHFGSFHFHSDRAAQDRLAERLAGEDASTHPAPGAGRANAIDALVRTPPEAFRPRLLEALLDPAHVGCAHLRLLLADPEAYGVRADLVAEMLRSVFRRLWAGDRRVVFDVLDGAHQEEGVVSIRTDTAIPGPLTLVTACPRHGDLELFVYHPEAVAWLQAMHAIFLVREGWILPQDVAELIQRQRRLGERQMETTLRRLAPGLPVFDVRLSARGEPVTGHAAVAEAMAESVLVRFDREIPVSNP